MAGFLLLQDRVNAACMARLGDGDAATGIAATVDGIGCDGIFDEGYNDIGGFGLMPPSFTCLSSVAADEGSTVVLDVDGRTFEVSSVEPDGNGMQKLVLKKVR